MSQAGLWDILRGTESTFRTGKYFGVVTAKVTENVDPEMLGRIKVSFPWLRDGDEDSSWVRIANKLGGKNFGFWTMPDIEDEVLVAFEHGDFRFPYVVGTLWSQASRPPIVGDLLNRDGSQAAAGTEERNQNGKNRFRFVRSKSGNTVSFDDSEGQGRGGVSLMDGTGLHRLDILTEQKKIVVRSQDGDVNFNAPSGVVQFNAQEIVVEADEIVGMSAEETARTTSKTTTGFLAKGSLSIRTNGELAIRSQGKGQIEALGGLFAIAKQSLEIEAIAGSASLQATGPVQIKGATVTLTAPEAPSAGVTLEEQRLNDLLSDILAAINGIILDMPANDRKALLGTLTNFPGQDPKLLAEADPERLPETRDLDAPGPEATRRMAAGPTCSACGVPAQFVCDNPHCQEEAHRHGLAIGPSPGTTVPSGGAASPPSTPAIPSAKDATPSIEQTEGALETDVPEQDPEDFSFGGTL